MNKTVIEKSMAISNHLFNKGLEAAKLRDLSSALDYLKRSLSFNKKNIKTRNLLGLIYFEIGEPVEAIKQWKSVIAIDSENPMANTYAKMILMNHNYIEKLNSAIKKYNQSLEYVQRGNLDLAVIQLKKVVSLNPKFIKAYLLLSISYMQEGHVDKAKKVLKKVLKIDRNNYQAKEYMASLMYGSVEEDQVEEPLKPASKSSGFNFSLSNSLQQFVALALGVAIGLAVVYFLIMPNRIEEKNAEIRVLDGQIVALTADLNTMTSNYETEADSAENFKALSSELQAALDVSDQQLDGVSSVLDALSTYVSGDKAKAADQLFLVDQADLVGTQAASIYEAAVASIYPEVVAEYYDLGFDLQDDYDYEEAAIALEVATKFLPEVLDVTNSDGTTFEVIYRARAYYYLGKSYYYTQRYELAKTNLEVVYNEYSDHYLNDDAKWFIDEIDGNN